MQMIPGSHRMGMPPHALTSDESNLLAGGQTVAGVSEKDATLYPLARGEASFHHGWTLRFSRPNESDDRRIGLSLHYMPTHTRQTLADWDSAALVRGEDHHNHFDHAPRPPADLDPETMAYHQRSAQALRSIVYDGADASRPTL